MVETSNAAWGEISEIFACPVCRGQLSRSDSRHDCSSCGRTYPVTDGLAEFLLAESSHGEFSAAEMQELLTLVSRDGWKQALNSYAKPRRPRVVELIRDERRRNVLKPLEAHCGDMVLDLGCGYGGVSLQLAKMFRRVVSLDGSKERVSLLNLIKQQEELSNVFPVCHNSILELPFPDAHFDAIVMVGVFEYLPLSLPDDSTYTAHQRCLSEFKRILKPGGHLLIASKNRFGWQFLKGGADHSRIRFAPVLPRPVTNLISLATRGEPYRIINYSIPGYRKIVEAAGFAGVKLSWPVPGYQLPDLVLPIDKNLGRSVRNQGHKVFTPGKQRVLLGLAKLGLLPLVVPDVSVLASKPTCGP